MTVASTVKPELVAGIRGRKQPRPIPCRFSHERHLTRFGGLFYCAKLPPMLYALMTLWLLPLIITAPHIRYTWQAVVVSGFSVVGFVVSCFYYLANG